MNNKKIISVIAVILAVLMLLGLVVGILPASVFADGEEDFSVNTQASLEELQARKEELSEKAEQSKATIEELEEGQAALIVQKAAYDERDAYIREQIAITDEQIEIYRGLIAEKEKEVDAAREQARAMLREGKKAEAVKLLNDLHARHCAEADKLLNELGAEAARLSN